MGDNYLYLYEYFLKKLINLSNFCIFFDLLLKEYHSFFYKLKYIIIDSIKIL